MNACDVADACRETFEFYAGETKTLYIHIGTASVITGLPMSFDLTPYVPDITNTAKVELLLPGVVGWKQATIVGNPQDGNIALLFTALMSNAATSGVVQGRLIDVNGLVTRFVTDTSITKKG